MTARVRLRSRMPGIEYAYKDIKNIKDPITAIVQAPGPMQKYALAKIHSVPLYRIYSLSGRCIGTVGSLSQNKAKSYSNGIYLIRAENSTIGKYSNGVHKVLIAK